MFASEIKESSLYKFISRWALFGGLAELALVVMMMAFVMPAAQGSGLSDDFMELIAAGKIPGLYRLAILLDASVWLAIGGLLVAFGILLWKYQPLKSIFVASLGIAQVSGFTGALIRLEGTTRLASSYLTANADAQAKIMQSYLDLQTIFNAHFDSGLLYALAFLIFAFAAWKMNEFPRWLTVMLGLVGALNLANDAVALAGGGYQFMLFFLALVAEIATFISSAIVFWRMPKEESEQRVGSLNQMAGD